jgi:tight adherence protein B
MPLAALFLAVAATLFLGRCTARAVHADVVDALVGSIPTSPARASRLLGRLADAARARRRALAAAGVSVALGFVGFRLAGLPAAAASGAAGLALPEIRRRHRIRRRSELLEGQLAEVVESCALAVRSGFSVVQALAFAAEEMSDPMRGLVDRLMGEQGLGTPFDDALQAFGDAIATEDARLFVLVMGIHHRSGGNVAAALEEVASTIRHRSAVRRELRALTAQGRISGSILGGLPVAFFLVLAATSHRELSPVYRSAPGIAMIVGGLVLEALAYGWIRHLLKVDL